MAQLSYNRTMPVAFAGMKGTSAEDTVRSFVSAEATEEIPFGVGVVLGAAANKAVLPTDAATAAKFVGVALHSHNYASPEQLGDTGIKPKVPISVLEEGDVWVTVEEAVVAGDRAFMRYDAGAGGTQLGAFRKSADTATALELKGCRYLTAASGGGLALLRVSVSATRATQ